MAQPEVFPRNTVPLDHHGPWTEAEFMALPEGSRVELLDGTLVMSPRGRLRHQVLSGRIFAVLDATCPPGMQAVPEFDVRVGPDRVFIPDASVLARRLGPDDKVVDAADVRLAVEIASPSTKLLDRHVKTRAYAEGRIERLLRVEWDADDRPIGLLHVLDGAAYRVEEFAGRPVVLDEPFPLTLDLVALADR